MYPHVAITINDDTHRKFRRQHYLLCTNIQHRSENQHRGPLPPRILSSKTTLSTPSKQSTAAVINGQTERPSSHLRASLDRSQLFPQASRLLFQICYPHLSGLLGLRIGGRGGTTFPRRGLAIITTNSVLAPAGATLTLPAPVGAARIRTAFGVLRALLLFLCDAKFLRIRLFDLCAFAEGGVGAAGKLGERGA